VATKTEKTLILTLTLVAIWVATNAFHSYQQSWHKPLGPALQLATVTRAPTHIGQTMTPPAMTDSFAWMFTTSTAVPVETSTPSINSCGLPSVMTLLAIGSDTRGNGYLYGLADVIRLVRIDTVTPKITVLEFPRDLWVEIPDIADNLNGQDHEKLNQAYLYGNPGFGYSNEPARGPGLLARTLALNFRTQIDHYAAINMQTFVKVVDAIGGIDIFLPETVDARTATDTNERLLFVKGDNHLNGTRALTLARVRIEGVFERANNQDRVLCALRKKLLSPETITKIPNIIKSFQGAVQTDLSPAQLSQLACFGAQLQSYQLHFISFPEDLFTGNRIYDPVFKKDVFIWEADFNQLRDYVDKFNRGEWSMNVAAANPQTKSGAPVNCQ